MEAKVAQNLINDLENHFGEFLVTIGNNHTFLGTNKNITENKNVQIETKEKMLVVIELFGEYPDEKLTTPTSSHILIVN